MAGAVSQIPVLLLSGFLGSGKTTLLSRALSHDDFSDTLVLVNELGAVGLDHDLLWSGGEVALSLDNGCICCSVSDDLIAMLADLFWKRLHRDIPRFSRVLIETTGIADPRAIVAKLRDDPLVAERYRYGGTVTVVDASSGMEGIARHEEALAQIVIADKIVLSHADKVTPAALDSLAAELGTLNTLADIVVSAKGSAGTADMFDLERPNSSDGAPAHSHDHQHAHHHQVETFSVALRPDLEPGQLRAVLEELALRGGETLLRAKGLAQVGGETLLIQMVGTALSDFETIANRSDRDGFLVVIGKGMDAPALRAVLADITQL